MSDRQQIYKESLVLKPGTLWAKLGERSDYALARGALQSIPTECELFNDAGMDWLVRILANLDRKDKAKKKQDKKRDVGINGRTKGKSC